ncbi:FtsK/SpoIIIE domain-containing protein [Sulfurimonas sp. HSL3-7]|uniref:FtsK/SpoIIIE domain-containing protein n=1 Tax=Sulfonitrofixus jiaomeiensis TaxID=3131938 RepID=UPI0031F75291
MTKEQADKEISNLKEQANSEITTLEEQINNEKSKLEKSHADTILQLNKIEEDKEKNFSNEIELTLNTYTQELEKTNIQCEKKKDIEQKKYEDDTSSLITSIEQEIEKFINNDIPALQKANSTYLEKYEQYIAKHQSNHELLKVFPDSVSIGYDKLTLSPNASFEIPAVVPFLGETSLKFDATDENHDLIQTIIMKTITSLPVGEYKFIGIDMQKAGGNLINLVELDEKIVGSGILHSKRSVMSAMEELSDAIGQLTQKYLGAKYSSLKEYNEDAQEVVEPYRILCVTNFPDKFDDTSLEHLEMIVSQGPTVGIQTILSISPSYKFDNPKIDDGILPYLSEIECLLVENSTRAIETFPSEVMQSLVTSINSKHRKVEKKIISFDSIVENTLWEKTTIDRIEAPLGRAGAKGVKSLILGESEHHALIAGATGSGKTVLLHTLINTLAHNYSPEELQLYLLDYKEGTEFSVYKNLPHMSVLSLSSERLFGLNILKGVQAEINRRGELFKSETGSNNIKEYRERSGKTLHRLVIIFDEFQVLVSGMDKIASEALDIFEDIVKRGRSFGVHLILSTQSLFGLDLGKIMGQIQVRIGMRMDESESQRLFSSDNNAAKYLERGEAIYNRDNGKEEANVKFGVAYIDNDSINKHVLMLKDIALERGIPLDTQRVFDTNLDADITNNTYFQKEHKVGRFSDAYIGEPNFISDQHVFFRIKRDIPANVLIVGDPKETVFSLISSILYSLSLTMDKASEFYTINLLGEDDEYKEELDFVTGLPVKSYIGHDLDEAENVIDNLNDELDKRELNKQTKYPTIILTIVAVHNARSFRSDGYNSSTYIQKLHRLVKDGAARNIHVILHSDRYNRLKEMVESSFFREFESAQIILRGEDSQKLFEDQGLFLDKVRSPHIGIIKGNQNKFDVDEFKVYPFAKVKALYDNCAHNNDKEDYPKFFNAVEIDTKEKTDDTYDSLFD